MLEIELLHKTSLEFTLFRAFAEFIVDQKKNNLKVDFYEQLNEILELSTKPGTLANRFSDVEKTGVFMLSQKSYEAFCHKFDIVFKKLSEKQDEYRDIGIAFYQWQNAINNKHGLNLVSEFENEKVPVVSNREQQKNNLSKENNLKQQTFENTEWFLFFFDDVTSYKNGSRLLHVGISWAVVKCFSTGNAELIKQKSPNEIQSLITYTGTYGLSKDGRDLMFVLKLNGERDLRINIYIGNATDRDFCVGMATNVTEEFDAWVVLLVRANKVNLPSLQPGFQARELRKESENELPDFLWDFFKDYSNSHLTVPKAGTGINNIQRIIDSRKAK